MKAILELVVMKTTTSRHRANLQLILHRPIHHMLNPSPMGLESKIFLMKTSLCVRLNERIIMSSTLQLPALVARDTVQGNTQQICGETND